MKFVITISRELGSQGSYIATAVAQKLNLRYLDREILHRAAEVAGYPDDEMVTQLEDKESVPGILGRIMEALQTSAAAPSEPSATRREIFVYDELAAMMMQADGLSREEAMAKTIAREQRTEKAGDYVDLVRQVIREYAETGDVVIVGRGGQVVLRDVPGVLRVRIGASEEVRVARVMERFKVDSKEAERQVRQGDRERSRYMKHFYGVDWQDPKLYDLVLNTDRLALERAVELIIAAAQP